MAWENGNSSGGSSTSYEWTTYTPTFSAWTAQNTVGTAPTYSGTFYAHYIVQDKNLRMNFNYGQTTAGTAGSGVYVFSMPSGYYIDTSLTGVLTNYSTSYYNFQPLTIGCFGNGSLNGGGTSFYSHKVIAVSSSYMACYIANSLLFSPASISFASTNMGFWFTAEVPIT